MWVANKLWTVNYDLKCGVNSDEKLCRSTKNKKISDFIPTYDFFFYFDSTIKRIKGIFVG